MIVLPHLFEPARLPLSWVPERLFPTCLEHLQDARAALTVHLHAVAGDCVAVGRSMARTYRRVTRLALLNESHSVSHFLLAERGLAKYPSYAVHRTRSAFHSLEHMQEYEAALEVRSARACSPPWHLFAVLPGSCHACSSNIAMCASCVWAGCCVITDPAAQPLSHGRCWHTMSRLP